MEQRQQYADELDSLQEEKDWNENGITLMKTYKQEMEEEDNELVMVDEMSPPPEINVNDIPNETSPEPASSPDFGLNAEFGPAEEDELDTVKQEEDSTAVKEEAEDARGVPPGQRAPGEVHPVHQTASEQCLMGKIDSALEDSVQSSKPRGQNPDPMAQYNKTDTRKAPHFVDVDIAYGSTEDGERERKRPKAGKGKGNATDSVNPTSDGYAANLERLRLLMKTKNVVAIHDPENIMDISQMIQENRDTTTDVLWERLHTLLTEKAKVSKTQIMQASQMIVKEFPEAEIVQYMKYFKSLPPGVRGGDGERSQSQPQSSEDGPYRPWDCLQAEEELRKHFLDDPENFPGMIIALAIYVFIELG